MTGASLTSLFTNLGEVIFALTGLICFSSALRGLKLKVGKVGTFLFWFLLGVTFMFGKFVNTAGIATPTPGKPIPGWVVGIIVVILGLLSATHQVKVPAFEESSQEERQENAQRYRYWVFIPAIALAVFAFILTSIKFTFPDLETPVTLPPALAVGGSALIALLIGALIFRPNPQKTRSDVDRLLMQVGPTSILPQLLIALGNIFTVAGVGTVIARFFANVIPANSTFIGVVMYIIGMVLFTMIMGNAFAAFQVITVGIGIPFVIHNGGDPAMVGALALTAGYCGTLMTPMAANFNVIPVSVLEIKDKYAVIKAQLPVALTMLVIHVVLMLVLAF